MNTVTFTDKDGTLTLTTKAEFLEKCPDPQNYDNFELATKFNVVFYLHNEAGPAIVDHYLEKVTGKPVHQYWVNGEPLNGTNEGEPLVFKQEALDRMIHHVGFKKDLEEIIS